MRIFVSDGLSPRGRGNPTDSRRRPRGARSIPAWAGEPVRDNSQLQARGVYPRVGGGTPQVKLPVPLAIGLSPRGRGNLSPSYPGISCQGSIPAWAGEPCGRDWRDMVRPVYPRVGGGTYSIGPLPWMGRGLSPRGRGNHRPVPCARWSAGSIPAWAGEPPWPKPTPSASAVYPRVGGGTHYRIQEDVRAGGLSPRGRGNPTPAIFIPQRRRSIPAWAGEPAGGWRGGIIPAVYPRVGGGTPGHCPIHPWAMGLSPRGRGNPAAWAGQWTKERSIPAWAGEPKGIPCLPWPTRVYPRVGGGTPSSSTRPGRTLGLSPRGRGNRPPFPPFQGGQRSIPAWAGEPWISRPSRRTATVYPRVGGGTEPTNLRLNPVGGLSPRGRGNPSCR